MRSLVASYGDALLQNVGVRWLTGLAAVPAVDSSHALDFKYTYQA